jgi:transposase
VSTTEIMDTSLRVKRRHKVWPEALKRKIVAACAVPGASVSMVARQYDVNSNQVFTWRKLYAEASDVTPLSQQQLLPVVVMPEPPAALPPSPTPPPVSTADVIEIELPGGYRVRIGSNIKVATLRAVLDALERR